MNQEGKPARADRVALYARVSSEAQAQEATIDSQLSMLRARIEADGYTIEPAWCFVDDGVSGTTLVRPGLERLRDQAAAGAVDRLYVLAPDRLARRHAHQMVPAAGGFRACGVDMVFVNRPLGTTPEDQLLLQVQSVIAEYERAKILERTPPAAGCTRRAPDASARCRTRLTATGTLTSMPAAALRPTKSSRTKRGWCNRSLIGSVGMGARYGKWPGGWKKWASAPVTA